MTTQTPSQPRSIRHDGHLAALQNKARKSAALARTVVDSGVFSEDDVNDLIFRSDIQQAVMAATRDEKGNQRWTSTSRERWVEVAAIAHAFLRDTQ